MYVQKGGSLAQRRTPSKVLDGAGTGDVFDGGAGQRFACARICAPKPKRVDGCFVGWCLGGCTRGCVRWSGRGCLDCCRGGGSESALHTTHKFTDVLIDSSRVRPRTREQRRDTRTAGKLDRHCLKPRGTGFLQARTDLGLERIEVCCAKVQFVEHQHDGFHGSSSGYGGRGGGCARHTTGTARRRRGLKKHSFDHIQCATYICFLGCSHHTFCLGRN